MKTFLRSAALAGLILSSIFVGAFSAVFSTVWVHNAFADSPVAVRGLIERYIRIPVLDEGHEVAVATSTGRVLEDTGSYSNEGDLMLFEWNTAVSIECVLRACFCVTMDDDVTIGSDTTCGDIADGGTPPDSTGGNACITVPAGGRVEFIVSKHHWSVMTGASAEQGLGAVASTSPSGYRTGFCSADGTPTAYYPCDNDDDCRNAADDGNGTCTDAAAGASFSQIAGVFLMHEAAVATSCSVRKDL